MKTTSHRLNLNPEGLEKFCIHLAGQSLFESKPDDKRTQYLMPDGKTRLQIRRCDSDTYLDITTTTLFRPSYVRKLVKAITPKGTEPCATISPNNPDLAYLYNYARENSYGETVVGGGYR